MAESASELNIQIELLKKDHAQLKEIFTKLDTSVEKIADATNNISRLLALQEQKVDAVQEDMAYFRDAIITYFEKSDASKNEILDNVKEMMKECHTEIADIDKRVSDIEKYKLVIWAIGGAFLFVIANYDNIHVWVSKLF